MEELAKAAGIIMILLAGMDVMLLLFRTTVRRLNAARLDGEFLHLLRDLYTDASQYDAALGEGSASSWQGSRKFRVAWREYETLNEDICSFYLTPCDEKPIPVFRPGQFLTFELTVPGQAKPVVRCYSLSDGPTERQYYRITVKRMRTPAQAPAGTPPGVSSSHFHDNIHEHDIVDVYAPSGTFYLDRSSPRPIVLIAGGVGLTPLLSMLNWLNASNSKREVWLFYGVTNRLDHAMYEHIQSVGRTMSNFHAVIFYSLPTDICRLGTDYDVAGFIDVEVMKPLLLDRSYEFYICGPPAMMKKVTADLRHWGVPEKDIMTESFGSAPTHLTEASKPARTGELEEKFAVTFSRSNKTVEWTPDTQSLLELAETSGIKARFACRSGNCGTCMTALWHGDVEYDEPPAQALEDGYCLPCVARPRTNLMLDL